MFTKVFLIIIILFLNLILIIHLINRFFINHIEVIINDHLYA